MGGAQHACLRSSFSSFCQNPKEYADPFLASEGGAKQEVRDGFSSLVLFTQAKAVAESPAAKKGIRVISVDDQRWARRDIKTVQLLYPSMGKMMALAAGKDDAWMVEDGVVTEGTSNNAYIVKDGTIVTRQLSNAILHGITRAAVLRFAREAQMKVEERPFSIEEAQDADEAFITSASAFVIGAKLREAPPRLPWLFWLWLAWSCSIAAVSSLERILCASANR